MQKIVFYVLWVTFGIQLFYFLYFYFRIIFKEKKKQLIDKSKAVSVIISAKNEAENLKNFLPKILCQNYPKFELIVINDASEDETLNVLKKFAKIYKQLKIVNITKSLGKKNAITKGIETSKYDFLLFTDADCYPVSKNWILSMMQGFDNNTELVLGYGGYEEDKSFLNKLIRFDTLFIAIKYLSFAKSGFAYMGVGRNLAYKKSLFFDNNGFNSHKNILSGDDDLFVNEIANKNNVKVLTSIASVTKSIPKKTWKDLLIQKRRHLTSGVKYKLIHKILLLLETFSLFIFYLSILFSLFFKVFIFSTYMLYFIRLFILIFIFSCFSKKIKEKRNIIFISIFDVLIPIINLYASLSNVFIKKRRWR